MIILTKKRKTVDENDNLIKKQLGTQDLAEEQLKNCSCCKELEISCSLLFSQ